MKTAVLLSRMKCRRTIAEIKSALEVSSQCVHEAEQKGVKLLPPVGGSHVTGPCLRCSNSGKWEDSKHDVASLRRLKAQVTDC
jgi:hypothetical protein